MIWTYTAIIITQKSIAFILLELALRRFSCQNPFLSSRFIAGVSDKFSKTKEFDSAKFAFLYEQNFFVLYQVFSKKGKKNEIPSTFDNKI